MKTNKITRGVLAILLLVCCLSGRIDDTQVEMISDIPLGAELVMAIPIGNNAEEEISVQTFLMKDQEVVGTDDSRKLGAYPTRLVKILF